MPRKRATSRRFGPEGVGGGRAPRGPVSNETHERVMRSIHRSGRGAVLGAVLLAVSGCTDRLPTLSGVEQFPGGALPTTIQVEIGTVEFLRQIVSFRGDTGVTDAWELVVAREFDGALSSNALAKLRGFPDSVEVRGDLTGDFRYEESTVVAQIPDTLSVFPAGVTLRLWTVTQPWDSAAVTWEDAVNRPEQRVAWQQPGGTPGQLVGTARWGRGEPERADSLIWSIPGEVVERLATGQVAGLMATMETEGGRVEIGRLALNARIRATAHADTVVTRRIAQGTQTFVFTPAPPRFQDELSIGGLTSDRMLIRIDLGDVLPLCPPGTLGACPPRSLSDVTLNRVDLVLDPLPVPSGFRPIAPVEVRARRLLRPDLGDRAPLGGLVAIERFDADSFLPGATEPVTMVITSAIAAALARGDTEIGLSLQVEPEASTFSYLWFDRNPRLRFVYTLPRTPQLP